MFFPLSDVQIACLSFYHFNFLICCFHYHLVKIFSDFPFDFFFNLWFSYKCMIYIPNIGVFEDILLLLIFNLVSSFVSFTNHFNYSSLCFWSQNSTIQDPFQVWFFYFIFFFKESLLLCCFPYVICFFRLQFAHFWNILLLASIVLHTLFFQPQ